MDLQYWLLEGPLEVPPEALHLDLLFDLGPGAGYSEEVAGLRRGCSNYSERPPEGHPGRYPLEDPTEMAHRPV